MSTLTLVMNLGSGNVACSCVLMIINIGVQGELCVSAPPTPPGDWKLREHGNTHSTPVNFSALVGSSFKSLRIHKLVITSKKRSNLVSSASDTPKSLWKTANKLLRRKSSSPLPHSSPGRPTSLASNFANFFTDKWKEGEGCGRRERGEICWTNVKLIPTPFGIVYKNTCRSKSYPWFTVTLRTFRSTVRRAENLWKCTHSALELL